MNIQAFASRSFGFASALILALAAPFAAAQTFPSKPLTMVFPFPAGSATEVAYRVFNAEASKVLGQPIVLETRPGANARLGIIAAKNSPPDGHFLAIINDSILVAQPLADASFKIEPGKDYAPLGLQFEYPLAVYGRLGLPYKDFRGLVAYAKANPGKVNFANSPTTQFPAELMRQAADIDITFIPYKGAEMLNDMMAGRIDLTITGASALNLISAGKLVAIATTGSRRWDALPDIPTFQEGGVNVDYNVWFGIVAAPGTPATTVAALNNAFNTALKSPEVLKSFKGYGYYPATRGLNAKDFTDFIQAQFGIWEPVIRKAGIKIN